MPATLMLRIRRKIGLTIMPVPYNVDGLIRGLRYLSAVVDEVGVHPGKVRCRDVPMVRVCTTHCGI